MISWGQGYEELTTGCLDELSKLFAYLATDPEKARDCELEVNSVRSEESCEWYLKHADHATAGIALKNGELIEVDLCHVHEGLADDEDVTFCDVCENNYCNVCCCECDKCTQCGYSIGSTNCDCEEVQSA